MAKSNLSWDIVDTKLVVEILAIKRKVSFDMGKVFPDYGKYTAVQQKTIANGLKQKLADHLARPTDMKLTPVEMIVELEALWKRLTTGHWNMEGTAKDTMKKRVDSAVVAATPEELAVLVKLGLAPAPEKEPETEQPKPEIKLNKKDKKDE